MGKKWKEIPIDSLESLKKAKNLFNNKNSEFFLLKKKLKTASFEEKKIIGKKIQALKEEAENYFLEASLNLEEKVKKNELESTWIDVAEETKIIGSQHPVNQVIERFRIWFLQNNFFEVEGPEIESDEYNFARLNMDENHPARASHDSLYVDEKYLLRTHNTGFSARILQQNPNKTFNQFSVGKVYRNDDEDQTHSHQFTQIDFVCVGKNVSISNLIWVLQSLLSFVLEEEVKIRLRPSFFPFTEPSAEVDIFYKGKWIEVLGSGILHPNVLKKAGYNDEFVGMAAGIGVERIAMIKYQLNDLRDFYLNDLRFLKQFKGEN